MAQFVIYDKVDITIKDQFTSERGAKISFTRKGYNSEKYAITTLRDFYDNVDKEVEVQSLMGGTVKIKESQRGTCVDPSTERYWCM